jgi:hypothetical protein
MQLGKQVPERRVNIGMGLRFLSGIVRPPVRAGRAVTLAVEIP